MYRLLRYFSITSLFALILVTILLVSFYRQIATNQLIALEEEKSIALTQAFANTLWPEFADFIAAKSATDEAALRALPEVQLLRAAVVSQMQGLSVIKVKVYNLAGRTMFSTEAAQIGQDKSENPGFLAARNREVVSEITYRDTFSAFEGEIYERDVLSTYLPIQSGGEEGAVEGVFELYSDVTPLMDRIETTQRNIFLVVSGLQLLLYAVLFFIVRRAETIMNSQYAKRIQAEAALQEMNAELESRVAERTADLQRTSEQLQLELEERKRNEAERERLLIAEREQRELAETLGRLGLALNAMLDLPILLDLICAESRGLYGAEAALVWLVQGEALVGFAGHGGVRDDFIGLSLPLSDPISLGPRVIREKRPIYVNAAQRSAQVNPELISRFEVQSILGVPLIKEERAIGALMILDSKDEARFGDADVAIGLLLGSHAAVAIDNARLYEDIQRRVERLDALRTIDITISASLDLRMTLNVLLEQVIHTLAVDAAEIYLYNHRAQVLKPVAQRGVPPGVFQDIGVRQQRHPARQVALERRMIQLPDLAQSKGDGTGAELILGEGFGAYFAVPLVSKGLVKGVLQVFHREPLFPASDWLEFFDMLAGQAAIAVENAELFDDLQRSNTELTMAYDMTLEGVAQALEFQAGEPSGHIRRMAELTVQLARRLNIRDEDLVHIYRGVLLHDFGQLSIPDPVLLKPGPLSPEEWEIVQQHPQFAYEVLSPIPYLRPALDIPYAHHEKWDGSGYPQGLAGEQIPLPARIFAIVDVWEALRTDRPHRPAWSNDRAQAYIKEQTGVHFDPHIVDIFFEQLEEVGQFQRDLEYS